MTDRHVALLNASYRDERTRRNFTREFDAAVESFAANEGELPDDYFEYDAVVVSGSGASVYGNEPWIDPLEASVREVVDDGVPLLGICFGHQLLAQALGGRVEAMDEYELGYRKMERVDDSDLLAGLPERFTSFATHSDTVAEIPQNAELIARNEYGVQGFRAGDAFGVQFHPEYDRETARLVARDKDLPDERIDLVLGEITDERVAAARETKLLFDNFLAHVDRLSRRPRDDRSRRLPD